MDTAAASFRTTQADFEWDRYEKVINEVDDFQTGTVYYRRAGQDVEMRAEIKMDGPSLKEVKPEPKDVLFSNGKIQVFQPKANQVTVYNAGNNRSEIEAYLVLGFGGSGQDLAKTFATAKLQLIPKSDKVRNTFKEILLWIDLDRGISVQQQFFEPQGDYRLAKYSKIRLNEKIGNDAFQLKTNSKTTTVSPRG
jgi:outer membrane lipoprotein-sorting protein